MFRTRTKQTVTVEDPAADVYPTEESGFGSHSLHAAAEASCVRCNRALTETDEVRRRADGSYVHLCC